MNSNQTNQPQFSTTPGIGPGHWQANKLAQDQERQVRVQVRPPVVYGPSAGRSHFSGHVAGRVNTDYDYLSFSRIDDDDYSDVE